MDTSLRRGRPPTRFPQRYFPGYASTATSPVGHFHSSIAAELAGQTGAGAASHRVCVPGNELDSFGPPARAGSRGGQAVRGGTLWSIAGRTGVPGTCRPDRLKMWGRLLVRGGPFGESVPIPVDAAGPALRPATGSSFRTGTTSENRDLILRLRPDIQALRPSHPRFDPGHPFEPGPPENATRGSLPRPQYGGRPSTRTGGRFRHLPARPDDRHTPRRSSRGGATRPPS